MANRFTIPHDWLRERMETVGIMDATRYSLERMGLSPQDMQEIMRKGVSPEWSAEWRAFVRRMGAGDELWFFESPHETWADFSGRNGFAIVRAGTVVKHMIVSRS